MTQNSNEVFDQLHLLSMFSTESHINGVKVHHDAKPEMVNAAKALFDKGLITQVDGGYLTDAGRELAQNLENILETINRYQ